MSTPTRIAAVIAAINSLRYEAGRLAGAPAVYLEERIEGMSDEAGLSEYLFVSDIYGQVAAVGYSEADLLANLEALETSEGLERLRVQQLAEIEHVSKKFDYSAFAGKAGPLSGSGCRAEMQAEEVRQ